MRKDAEGCRCSVPATGLSLLASRGAALSYLGTTSLPLKLKRWLSDVDLCFPVGARVSGLPPAEQRMGLILRCFNPNTASSPASNLDWALGRPGAGTCPPRACRVPGCPHLGLSQPTPSKHGVGLALAQGGGVLQLAFGVMTISSPVL